MPAAKFIAGDWGTSNLRLFLCDAEGAALDAISGPGAADASGRFAPVFDSLTARWKESHGALPAVLCGMVGSSLGWTQAPYLPCPARPEQIVNACASLQEGAIAVVPGLSCRNRFNAPDFMRGEETQIFGALGQDTGAADSGKRALIGLPGTHAKWAVVQAGRIERFHTFMTGEVFAALREHTILGRTMVTPEHPDTDAFLHGVNIARDRGQAGMLATVFSSRTLGLTGQLSREQQPDYLSGLLIGHELAGLEAVLTQQQNSLAGQHLRLIGNEALCERYRVALAQFGCTHAELVKHATERGLWRVATQAGLVNPAAQTAHAG